MLTIGRVRAAAEKVFAGGLHGDAQDPVIEGDTHGTFCILLDEDWWLESYEIAQLETELRTPLHWQARPEDGITLVIWEAP